MSVRHGGLREHGPAARFLIPDSTVDEAVRRKRGTPPGAGPSTPLRSAARCAPPLALPDAASLRALRADDAEPEVVATHAEADSARTVRARGAVRRAALPAQAEVTGVAVPVDLASLAAEADLVGGYALRTDVARAARDLEERGAAREEGAAVAFGRTAGLGEPWHHRAGRHRRVERRAVALLGGLDQPVPADRRRRAALVRDATPATRLPRWAHAARAAAAVIAAGLVRAVGRAATHIGRAAAAASLRWRASAAVEQVPAVSVGDHPTILPCRRAGCRATAHTKHGSSVPDRRFHAVCTATTDVRRALPAVGFAAVVGRHLAGSAQRQRERRQDGGKPTSREGRHVLALVV